MLNTLLISQLFAFISFGVGNSDLSIFFLIFLVFIYLLQTKITTKELFSITCITIVAVLFIATWEISLAKLTASLILIMIVYSISENPKYQLSANVILAFSLIWWIGVVATMFQRDVFEFLIYRVGAIEGWGRGYSGLTAEPSLQGTYSAMYFGIFVNLLRTNTKEKRQKKFVLSKQKLKLQISILLMLFCVMMSMSMLAYIMFAGVLGYLKFYRIITFGTIIAIGVIYFSLSESYRIYIVVYYLINQDWSSLISDNSIMHRLTSFLVFINPASYQEGQSLSAGLSPLVYLFGFAGQAIVISLLYFFVPFRDVVRRGFKSIALTCLYVVMFVVGPITIVPFWSMIALEKKHG